MITEVTWEEHKNVWAANLNCEPKVNPAGGEGGGGGTEACLDLELCHASSMPIEKNNKSNTKNSTKSKPLRPDAF